MDRRDDGSGDGLFAALLPGPRTESTIDWLLHWLAVVLAAILALASLVVIAIAVGAGWHFLNLQNPLGSSNSPAAWANFATFMSFVAQALIGGATLVAALLLSGVLTRRLERQKTAEQRSRELVRLSEKMVDTEFYLKVMLPAWEVALKWMDKDLPDGDAYRAEVVGAELRLPKNYSRNGEKSLAENSARMHPHYQPYDIPHDGKPAVIAELSESLAFATWVRFWRNVKFLIDRKLIDQTDARHLFREWYMWWAPFMTEFVAVCEEVIARLKRKYGYVPNEESWAQSSIVKLRELHQDFGILPHCGHSEDSFKDRVEKLTVPIMREVIAAMESGRNDHIDGSFDPRFIVTEEPHQPTSAG